MKRQAVLQFGVALSILLPSVALQAGEVAPHSRCHTR